MWSLMVPVDIPNMDVIAGPQNEIAVAPENDVILVIAFLRKFRAEDATGRGAGFTDVLITPGTPQAIHQDGTESGVGCKPGAGVAEVLTISFNSLLGLK